MTVVIAEIVGVSCTLFGESRHLLLSISEALLVILGQFVNAKINLSVLMGFWELYEKFSCKNWEIKKLEFIIQFKYMGSDPSLNLSFTHVHCHLFSIMMPVPVIIEIMSLGFSTALQWLLDVSSILSLCTWLDMLGKDLCCWAFLRCTPKIPIISHL